MPPSLAAAPTGPCSMPSTAVSRRPRFARPTAQGAPRCARLAGVPVGAILLSEEFAGDGEVFFRLACAMEFEGIVSKRSDRPYHSGRCEDWLKVKCVKSGEFVVIGYMPSTSPRGAIASLLVAIEDVDFSDYKVAQPSLPRKRARTKALPANSWNVGVQ